MSKLLSDEELLWHIRKTENPHYACEFKQDNTERKTVKCGGCLHSSESVRNAENALLDLINTQKRLYAESVIDNAIEDVAGYQAMSNRATVTVNELMNPNAGFRAYAKDLAEQRARISR